MSKAIDLPAHYGALSCPSSTSDSSLEHGVTIFRRMQKNEADNDNSAHRLVIYGVCLIVPDALLVRSPHIPNLSTTFRAAAATLNHHLRHVEPPLNQGAALRRPRVGNQEPERQPRRDRGALRHDEPAAAVHAPACHHERIPVRLSSILLPPCFVHCVKLTARFMAVSRLLDNELNEVTAQAQTQQQNTQEQSP